MECNKDEALKAKEIAEKKLLEKDYTAAKILARKARDMDPSLDGITQFLATIEVYVSAGQKVNGEIDWYRVLGVQPTADVQTIRRRYRKLALTLHPDKNKSVGADEAFKFITEAWSLLSDQGKRTAYDQRRNPGIHQATPGGTPSAPAYQNGVYNNSSTAYWRDRDQRRATHPNPTTVPPVSLKRTFWTICRSCRTKFEYSARYANCTLICVSCDQSFLAFEGSPPPIYRNASSTSSSSQMNQNNINSTRMEANNNVPGRTPMSAFNPSFGSVPSFIPRSRSNVTASYSTAADTSDNLRVSPNTIKRPREESTPLDSAPQASHFGSNSVLGEDMSRKKNCSEERRFMQTEAAPQNEGRSVANGFGAQKDSSDTGSTNASGNYRRYGFREVPQLQMRKMLIEKAQKDIQKKLRELNDSSKSRNSNKSKTTDTEVREKHKKKTTNGVKPGAKPGAREFADSDTIDKKCVSFDLQVTDSISMSVPDPDFHDFDGDRIEKAFGENQVWAVYDEDDGMPRYYALIHSVISKRPFRMSISWLNSKTNDDLAPIEWVSCGFTKTSGDFRIGKRGLFSSLNSFSHRVQCEKGLRGVFHIYPKKGEVWAVYRNWSLDWNLFTDVKEVHQYDMVEILEDFNEEKGVNVTPLIKVIGFKTVFRRNLDPRKIRHIPKAELFRLSHQVPSYLLTGEEGDNSPKGFLELDPAAMPMELLQVLTEEQEPVIWNDKNFKEIGSAEGRKGSKPAEDGSGKEVAEAEGKRGSKPAEDGSGKEVAEAEGKKGSKPEILYVYKRRRFREKKAL